MASRLSHSPQHKRAALTSVLLALSQQRAYTPAYQLGALIDVGGRQPLTTPSAVAFITHYYMDYYSLTDPGWMEG